jgi:hypothetical protein
MPIKIRFYLGLIVLFNENLIIRPKPPNVRADRDCEFACAPEERDRLDHQTHKIGCAIGVRQSEVINTLYISMGNIMGSKKTTRLASSAAEEQRQFIKLVLDDIATKVGSGLRAARLGFPVYLSVPSGGDALATVACPVDPTDSEWSRATEIVCRVIGEGLKGIKLHSRPLQCTAVNAIVGAADITADE